MSTEDAFCAICGEPWPCERARLRVLSPRAEPVDWDTAWRIAPSGSVEREVAPLPDPPHKGLSAMTGSEQALRAEPLTLWWCKRQDGVIVEHETTSTERHSGHVRCIPVGNDD